MSDNAVVLKDLFRLVCHEQIGEGMSRKVWTSKVLPDLVFKVEEEGHFFQNVMEWETWQRIKDTEHAKWFAPCEQISHCGSVLLMRRTEPARVKDFPAKMPAFFTDLKRGNFGILDGRLVCHDYGIHLLMENGMTKRMRAAHWYDR